MGLDDIKIDLLHWQRGYHIDQEEEEEIKTIKHKYFRAIDMADFDLLEEIFDPDVQVDYRGGTYRWQESGKDAIISALKFSFHNQKE